MRRERLELLRQYVVNISIEYGALVCSNPQAHYVLDADGKPMLVLEEDVDDQNEVLEMAGTKEAEVVDSREELVELVLNQE